MLERCIEVLKKGKRIIYIVPSRELADHIRQEFMAGFGGLINADVIVIDELEVSCAGEFLGERRVLSEDVAVVVLKEVMEELAQKGKLHFYDKVYGRYGFLRGLIQAIKKIKRQNLSCEELLRKAQDTCEEMLIKKAENLVAIYEAYNSKLRRLGFADQEDVARIAVENSGRCTYLDDVELIAVDGYINLDRIDAELLKSIVESRHIKVIGHVPMNTPFIDRFIEGEVYKDFEEIGAEIVMYDFARDCKFKRAAACLFTGDRLPAPAKGIKVLNAPCLEDEVRQAAKLIKSLLYEKKTIPENIAVITGDSGDYREYIARIFEEMNLDTNLGRYMKLSSVPLIRDLFILFSAGKEATESGLNMASPYLSGNAGADFKKINEKLCEIHSVDKIRYYAVELINIIDELKIKQKLNDMYKNRDISSDIFVRDLKAYISLVEILMRIEREYADFDIQIEFGDFLEFLKRHIQEATISQKGGNPAGIKILNPDLLKGTAYDYVFFLGLNEGVFPAAPPKGGFFTSHEKELLAERGVNLESPEWELTREKIRFILSVASAREGLFLSYRTAGEDGSYLIKSPFLEELIFAARLDESPYAITDSRSMRQRFSTDYDDIWSLREAVEKAIICMPAEIAGEEDLGTFQENADGTIKANSSEGEIPYDNLKNRVEWLCAIDTAYFAQEKIGRVGPEGVRKFGEDYFFSPSQLNSFVYCPFRFFVERVLQVAVEDDEDVIRARDKGKLYHDILKRYYEGYKEVMVFNEERLNEKASEAFDAAGLKDENIAASVFKDEIIKVLRGFLIKDSAFLSGYFNATGKLLKPYYLEKSFYDEELFEDIKFYARVDRVDLEFENSRPTGRFLIMDYKTKSGRNLRDCLEDRDFQLVMYYHLVKKALRKDLNLPDPECISLLYCDLENCRYEGIIVEEERKPLGKNRGSIDTISRDNFEFVMDYFKDLAAHLIHDIKNGNFAPPERCPFVNTYSGHRCKYRIICRYDGTKLSGKKR